MRKIGVFGGSFDPVHNAHIETARQAVDEFGLDFVIFIPSYLPPHKLRLQASSQDRLNMLSLAVKNNSKFLIDTFEIQNKRIVYSFETLDYLQKKYYKDILKLIIGSDTFNQLDEWVKPEYIAEKYGFFVMKRPDIAVDFNSKYSKYAVFSEFLMKNISSTQIRDMIKNNAADIESMVPKEVLKYIKENNLYGK